MIFLGDERWLTAPLTTPTLIRVFLRDFDNRNLGALLYQDRFQGRVYRTFPSTLGSFHEFVTAIRFAGVSL